ncbi:antitoxin family protein [Thermococcus sibiricus]|uniref:Antitoxin n=1 Tax=Thermococcus sibiricus (strain DSM 12597 / MM 739) TaxID=604354 RepID=C6A0B2_THESM|nr:antitoxin family protein [Thermococcus sibiricus]ACS91093.1 hypothetical protein TSIB_2046 [Thermococcus sibiricus MM 739]
MPIIVEAVYENGVLKPLKKLNLKDGQKVRIKVELDVSEYYGVFGKASSKELKELEEEVKIFLKGDKDALRLQKA